MSTESTLNQPLESLSHEELVAKCHQLITSNKKLQKELESIKSSPNNEKSKSKSAKVKESKQRPLDFTKYKKRRIALRFLYLGWDYQGFAAQENTANTIEGELFSALLKARLIEDRSTAHYSRCGRTDKGVSAFGQVIALDVRSNTKVDEDDEGKSRHEISYVKALNRMLPSAIRMVAYTEVGEEFDARFSCRTRTYKYFFPVCQLNIKLMHEASQKLVGEKDFRNFCKVDVGNNVNHFVRNVVSFDVRRLNDSCSSEDDMCEMEITGLAFLWHQVRCMAAVLFLVGMRLERPEVIDFLLDVKQCPKRPQYGIASEIPLVLYDCSFDGIEWKYEEDFNEQNISCLHQVWLQKAVQAASLSRILGDLRKKSADSVISIASLLPSITSSKDYKPLHKRSVCGGIDRHLQKQAVKRLKLEERYATKRLKVEEKHMDDINMQESKPPDS